MKFFKNRVVAIVLCVLIVAGATLLNTAIRFGSVCREIAGSFYHDEEISSQLEVLYSEAVSLAVIAGNNGIDATALLSATNELHQSLSQSSGASSVYAAYEKLNTELTAMEQKLLAVALSDSDAQSVSSSLVQIHAAQVRLASSAYNANVRDFLRRYDHFPTNILAKLAGVTLPEEFA